jgi:hypothetical protein
MKPELLFLILFLFGFVLYCFLGNNPGFYKKIEGMNTVESSSNDSNNSNASNDSGASNNSYENYNHYNGTSIATKYYGPNGEVVVVNSNSSITVINASGTSVEYKASGSSSSGSTNIEAITFMGPNGETATFVSGSNGGKAIKITDTNGNSLLYGEKPVSSGSSSSLTSYYGSTGNAVPNNSVYAYVSPSSSTYSSTSSSTSSEYGQMYQPSQPSQSYDYSSSLPPGIPKSQMLPGQEDLYILKSQVVPPVCPACNPVVIYKDKECQACPACARCPEPNFECKKVPNYNAINNEYLPTPVLNSFSSFGM